MLLREPHLLDRLFVERRIVAVVKVEPGTRRKHEDTHGRGRDGRERLRRTVLRTVFLRRFVDHAKRELVFTLFEFGLRNAPARKQLLGALVLVAKARDVFVDAAPFARRIVSAREQTPEEKADGAPGEKKRDDNENNLKFHIRSPRSLKRPPGVEPRTFQRIRRS